MILQGGSHINILHRTALHLPDLHKIRGLIPNGSLGRQTVFQDIVGIGYKTGISRDLGMALCEIRDRRHVPLHTLPVRRIRFFDQIPLLPKINTIGFLFPENAVFIQLQ